MAARLAQRHASMRLPMRWMRFAAPWLGLSALVLFMVALMGWPLAAIVAQAGQDGDWTGAWQSQWADPLLQWRWTWTLLQAAISTGVASVLGVPLGWLLARHDFIGRRVVLHSLFLPFVTPTLVAAMGLLAMWGAQSSWVQLLGALHAWFVEPWTGVAMAAPNDDGRPVLVIVGNVFFNAGLMARAAQLGFEASHATHLAAARSLGATPWRCFWRVEWPAAKVWVAASACLVFMYCASSFGLPLILGGDDYATVEVEIYVLVAQQLQLAPAAVLAWMMLLFLMFLAMLQVALDRMAHKAVKPKAPPRQPLQGVLPRSAAGACVGLWIVLCALPLLALLVQALRLVIQDSGWVLNLLQQDDVLLALGNTLRFTALATVGAGVLGVTHATLASRWPWLRVLTWLPVAVSPVVLALGLLLAYPSQMDSLALLLLAYVLLAYPLVAQSVRTGLDAVPVSLLQVARSLGCSQWRCFWRVTWPLIQPALRRGLGLAAAVSLGEFAVTLLLSRPEWLTVPTLIYQYLGQPGQSNLDAARVLTALLLVLSMLIFVTMDAVAGRFGKWQVSA